jgi:outer membrane lipoprotein-sorting protein
MRSIASRAILPICALLLALAVGACAQPAATPVPPTATAAPAKPAAAPTAVPTVAPTVAPTTAPTIAPTTAPTVAPTTAPTVAPTATALAKPTTAPAAASPTAAAKPAAGAPSLADLMAKLQGTAEYSFDTKMTVRGEALNGKNAIKGQKMRQEVSVQGQKALILADMSKKLAYIVMVDQKTALKMDLSQMEQQGQEVNSPSDMVAGLPKDAKFVGLDTVDGKPAAVFEATVNKNTTKLWLWVEKGLPLKSESTTPEGKTTIEFLNYSFTSLADSMFELPAGVQVVDFNDMMPGKPTAKP